MAEIGVDPDCVVAAAVGYAVAYAHVVLDGGDVVCGLLGNLWKGDGGFGLGW